MTTYERAKVHKTLNGLLPTTNPESDKSFGQNAFQTIPDILFSNAEAIVSTFVRAPKVVFAKFLFVFEEIRIFGARQTIPRDILLQILLALYDSFCSFSEM